MVEPATFELPRDPAAGSVARRLVERHMSDELSAPALDDLKLVVTELVDNAYLHGRGRVWLKLDRQSDRIRVEVIDEGEGAAVKVRPEASADGGHGLRIVEQLSRRWGAHEGTTHVWTELPLEP